MAPRTKTLQNRFYTCLGRFTVMWACMEMGLDVLALLTSEVDSPLRRKTPHQLAAKVEFIRKHLVCQLAPADQAKLEAILSKIDKISTHRHDLIHGASLAEKLDGEDWLVTFGALLQPRNRPRRPAVKFTVGTNTIRKRSRNSAP